MCLIIMSCLFSFFYVFFVLAVLRAFFVSVRPFTVIARTCYCACVFLVGCIWSVIHHCCEALGVMVFLGYLWERCWIEVHGSCIVLIFSFVVSSSVSLIFSLSVSSLSLSVSLVLFLSLCLLSVSLSLSLSFFVSISLFPVF